MKIKRTIKNLYLIKVLLAIGCVAGMLLLFIAATLSDIEAVSLKQIFVKFAVAVSLMGFCSAGICFCQREEQRLSLLLHSKAKTFTIRRKSA